MAPLARRNGWHLLLPEFRGPNLSSNPRAREACASRLAMQDVLDAVEFVRDACAVRDDALFLLGGSGGGHMAMMLAAFKPTAWRSIAAFCGITDLEAWHRENPNYAPHIAACCGGPPSSATLSEYRARSPIHHAEPIARAHLTIYHGKYDKSVPFTHGLRMFEEICRASPQSRVFLHIFDGGHDIRIEWAEAQFRACLEGLQPQNQAISR